MKFFLHVLFLLCWSIFAQAEVITEFDGESWKTTEDKTGAALDPFRQEHRFIADSKTKMRQASDLVNKWHQLQPHPIRLALQGEEGTGGILMPLPAEAKPTSLMIIVTCDPRGIDVGCIRSSENVLELEVFETGRMSVDYDGLEKFLAVVKSGVKKANDEKVPAICCLNLRSETSWGQMVRMLQIVKSAGCNHGIIRIDDQFGGWDIEVKQDKRVNPPTPDVNTDKMLAIPSLNNENQPKPMRIVVNISDDGTLKSEKGNVLESDKDVSSYVKQAKEVAAASGREYKLYLRGEKNAVFKYSRRVVMLASAVGVSEVVFATFEENIKNEADAPIKLPSNKVEKKLEIVKVIIKVYDDGTVTDETGKQLGIDANLADYMRSAKQNAVKAGKDVEILLQISRQAPWHSVQNAMNYATSAEIEKIKFLNLQVKDTIEKKN
jgi:biopolymer transport protein ExbD